MAPAPSSVTPTYVSGNEIDLTWQDNAVAAGGFQVRELPPKGNWTTPVTIAPNETSYVASGPFNAGDTWEFEVRAVDAAGNPGSVDAAASIPVPSTVPSQPTGLSAQVEASDEVKLSWSDTANDFTGFTVERQRSGRHDVAKHRDDNGHHV